MTSIETIETKVRSILRLSNGYELLRGFFVRDSSGEIVLRPVLGGKSYYTMPGNLTPTANNTQYQTLDFISERIKPPFVVDTSYFTFREGLMREQVNELTAKVEKYYDGIRANYPEMLGQFLFKPDLVFWKEGLLDNSFGKQIREKIALLYCAYEKKC